MCIILQFCFDNLEYFQIVILNLRRFKIVIGAERAKRAEPHTSRFNDNFVGMLRYDLIVNLLFNFSRIPDVLLFEIKRYRNSFAKEAYCKLCPRWFYHILVFIYVNHFLPFMVCEKDPTIKCL